MNYKKELAMYGTVKAHRIQPRIDIIKSLPHTPQNEIDFCLQCKRKKCSGDCPQIKEFRSINKQ